MLMFDVNDIHTLTEFNRSAKEHIERLKETGRPAVLTVNGKPSLVVQDAESYQQMLNIIEAWDIADSARLVRDSLNQIKKGEAGLSVDELESRLNEKHGFGKVE